LTGITLLHMTTHFMAATWRLITASILTAIIMSAVIKRVLKLARRLRLRKRRAQRYTAAMAAIPQRADNRATFLNALDVMQSAQWLPIEAKYLTKGTHALIPSRVPVNVTITGNIAADTVRSIMKYKHIKHLHMELVDVTPDVITVLSQIVTQPTFASTSCLQSCTIDDFDSLDAVTAQKLFDNLPVTLHTLSITQSDAAQFESGQFQQLAWPTSIKHLTITKIGFKVMLPEGLEILTMINCWPNSLQVPSTLLEFHTTNCRAMPRLPHGLLVLQMHTVRAAVDIEIDGKIPDTVTHLKLCETQTRTVSLWPSQLKVLQVGNLYHHELGVLPDSLQELTCKITGQTANIPLRSLPKGLKVLDISRMTLLMNALPVGLEVFRYDCFKSTLIPQLPDSLKELRIGQWNLIQLPVGLPQSLEILDLRYSYFYKQVITDAMLPVSLKALYVFEEYEHRQLLATLRPSITVHYVPPRYTLLTQRIW
jgi:hypothetical protein